MWVAKPGSVPYRKPDFGSLRGPSRSLPINRQLAFAAGFGSCSRFDVCQQGNPRWVVDLQNSVPYAQTIEGRALSCTRGSTHYAKRSATFYPEICVTGSVSFALRMSAKDLSTRQDFGGIWANSSGLRSFLISTAGGNTTPQFYLAYDAAGGVVGSGNSSTAMSVGVWYTLIGTWNSASKDLTLWMNGVSVASANQAGKSMNQCSSLGGLGVGAEFDASFPTSAYFSGALLWNRVLSTQEIRIISRDFWAGFRRQSWMWMPVPSAPAGGNMPLIVSGSIIGGNSRIGRGLIV